MIFHLMTTGHCMRVEVPPGEENDFLENIKNLMNSHKNNREAVIIDNMIIRPYDIICVHHEDVDLHEVHGDLT